MRDKLIRIANDICGDSDCQCGYREIAAELAGLRCDKCRHWGDPVGTSGWAECGVTYSSHMTEIREQGGYLDTSPDFSCALWEQKP